MRRRTLLAMLLVACGRGAEREPAVNDRASVVAAELVPSGVQGGCPATGSWSRCAVLDRLDRAGLAPRDDTVAVNEPPLAATGFQLRVGRAELELYVYPDVAARERELRLLYRAKYAAFYAPVTMQSMPTLIYSANLIAILHSRNDHLRERV